MDRPGGVLLDLDGTIYEADRVVPGAPEAVARLRRAGLAVAFCTNTTRMPRRALGERLAALRIPAVPGEIVTAPAAAAAWLRAEGIRRVALYVAEATLEEFPDCTLDDAAPEAVVLGDLAAGWTFAVLNRAFAGPGRATGLRAVLVRSGKYRVGDEATVTPAPDAVVDSVARLPALFGVE